MAPVILAVLAGCAAQTAREAAPPAERPTAEAIANATYRAGLLEGRPVTLRDGRYEGDERYVAWLLPAPVARGVVAGRPSAAVLFTESGGGSGTFVSLVLLQESSGGALWVASTLLGDRPRVNRVEIEADGAVLVDMLQVGEKDAFCCPSTPVSVRYVLQGGELIARSLATGPR